MKIHYESFKARGRAGRALMKKLSAIQEQGAEASGDFFYRPLTGKVKAQNFCLRGPANLVIAFDRLIEEHEVEVPHSTITGDCTFKAK